MPSLLEMLQRAAEEHEDEKPQTVLPEAAVVRLREAALRYRELLDGPRFAVDDLVTPVADANVKGAGEPHLVVEVRRTEPNFQSEKIATSSYGMRLDMRVLCLSREHGTMSAFWVESASFERYTGPGADVTP